MKDCLICMDVMKGYVILECGHECCAKCFAQHSRVNNTCPFCRKAYAPPVNKTNLVYEAEAPSFEEMNSAESLFFSAHERQVGRRISRQTRRRTMDQEFTAF